MEIITDSIAAQQRPYMYERTVVDTVESATDHLGRDFTTQVYGMVKDYYMKVSSARCMAMPIADTIKRMF